MTTDNQTIEKKLRRTKVGFNVVAGGLVAAAAAASTVDFVLAMPFAAAAIATYVAQPTKASVKQAKEARAKVTKEAAQIKPHVSTPAEYRFGTAAALAGGGAVVTVFATLATASDPNLLINVTNAMTGGKLNLYPLITDNALNAPLITLGVGTVASLTAGAIGYGATAGIQALTGNYHSKPKGPSV